MALAQKPEYVASNKTDNNFVVTDGLYVLAGIHLPQTDAMNNETSLNVYSLARRYVKVKVTLEQATKAQKRSRGIVLLIL